MTLRTGRGFAAIEYPTGMNQGGDPSQAWIKVKPDGGIDVFAGTVDLGQGSKTVHTQIVADTIGVPYDWVTMSNGDTDSSPICQGTFASRGTLVGGNAVRLAAERTRDRILDVAATLLDTARENLTIEDGKVVSLVDGAVEMSLVDLAKAATWGLGEMLVGSATYMKPQSIPDPDTGECDPHYAVSYAVCVVDIEIDDETGELRVTDMLAVYDVGRALNPGLVEGQIDGGNIMGLGYSLLEESFPRYPEIDHRGGQFGSYLVPAARDLPNMRNVIIENPSAVGPFGAKAIGEMASNGQAPAIAAAIYRAIGVWLPQLPATPERVLDALDAGRQPRREGKWVRYDENLSLDAVSQAPDSAYLRVDTELRAAAGRS